MTQISKHPLPAINSILAHSLELPCGAVLKNRIVKSAMSDSLGDGEGNPTDIQMRLYEKWAYGGVALSLIGEVQVDPRHPEKPGNLVLGPDTDQHSMRALARKGATNSAYIWPQLGHAGALSHLPISQPKGPSPLEIEGLSCQGMSLDNIHDLPFAYAKAAKLAKDLGFGGVQIHAGHGFLLSQFLSPLFNQRTDAYGGAILARFRVIGEIIDQVRKAVGPSFPIGIKINSTDNLIGGLTEDDALEVIRLLDQTSIDLIDISGGTYFPGAVSSSDKSSSGPYFIDFAKRAKKITKIPIMATGGFVTKEQAVDAIENGSVDMVGLARAMVLNPQLANTWLSDEGGDPEFPIFNAPPRGGITAWYSMRLTAIGNGTENQFDDTPQAALQDYEDRDDKRCQVWLKKFPL